VVTGSSGRQRFPRAARLTRPSDFKRVFDRPVVSADALFRVLGRAGAGRQPRLGLAVSRRVERAATGRNRIKRIVRESFRQYFAATGACDRPVDVVVLPRQACSEAGNRQLSQSLERHWARIVTRLAGASAGDETA
jgi:ribonuclease P protein component